MRIEYKGTPLESLLEYSKIRSIDFVYLNEDEYNTWVSEARENQILERDNGFWFTVKDSDLVFYLE